MLRNKARTWFIMSYDKGSVIFLILNYFMILHIRIDNYLPLLTFQVETKYFVATQTLKLRATH